jgi:hypothetical protein
LVFSADSHALLPRQTALTAGLYTDLSRHRSSVRAHAGGGASPPGRGRSVGPTRSHTSEIPASRSSRNERHAGEDHERPSDPECRSRSVHRNSW